MKIKIVSVAGITKDAVNRARGSVLIHFMRRHYKKAGKNSLLHICYSAKSKAFCLVSLKVPAAVYNDIASQFKQERSDDLWPI